MMLLDDLSSNPFLNLLSLIHFFILLPPTTCPTVGTIVLCYIYKYMTKITFSDPIQRYMRFPIPTAKSFYPPTAPLSLTFFPTLVFLSTSIFPFFSYPHQPYQSKILPPHLTSNDASYIYISLPSFNLCSFSSPLFNQPFVHTATHSSCYLFLSQQYHST